MQVLEYLCVVTTGLTLGLTAGCRLLSSVTDE